MSRSSPVRLSLGPLSVYVASLDGCPNLAEFVAALPSGMPVVWLDSARQHAVTGRWSIVGYDPWLTFTAHGDRLELRTSDATQSWRGHPLDGLRQVLRRYRLRAGGRAARMEEWGVVGRAVGFLGYLSYELNRWIERLPEPQPSERPLAELAWFGMRVSVLVDHAQQRSWVLSVIDPHSPQSLARRQAMEAFEGALDQLQPEGAAPFSVAGPEWWASRAAASPRPTTTQAEFERMVARALEHIRAGDIFQANVSQRFTMPWHGHPLALYRTLRRINPSPFACFLSWEDLAVVSCSPERLVRVQRGRAETRPIAGTRPRGMTPESDAMNSLELLLSEKERAEHIMLVDLARNDLGRVCAAGSVAVDELMAIEEYSHVMHIVSNVSGALRPSIDPVDVIRAVFPGGTITGCPKVRCMEILRELEPVPRGLYTGSVGSIGIDGTMDLNLAIRTMVRQADALSFHVGAGIVADSVPEREYHETLAKAAALMEALGASGGQRPSYSHEEPGR
ncbi:MAG: hypothetical protein COV75_05210 [Candidatus Omnitrophica bacterium CG11_big_fil_rev_8_21_14_0_20_63_9]|nr:MAG: hypothetical protein COV75_05210 [Candidatus Omnitrophica bacterium CG11_big_fil_rev_8_21_14_0_20_63_9]